MFTNNESKSNSPQGPKVLKVSVDSAFTVLNAPESPKTPPSQVRKDTNMTALFNSIKNDHYLKHQYKIGEVSGERYKKAKEEQEAAMSGRVCGSAKKVMKDG